MGLVRSPTLRHLCEALFLACLLAQASVSADPLWPRKPTAELVVGAAPFSPSLSAIRLSVPGGRIGGADWLQRVDAHLWYLADSAWLFPASYLELGVGARWAWLEGPRLLLASGLGTALAWQTLESTVSLPLVLDGLARYALSRRVCLQPELELLLFGQGFAASGRLGVRCALCRPLRFGLLLGAAAAYGWVGAWDLEPDGGAAQISLSAGYTW